MRLEKLKKVKILEYNNRMVRMIGAIEGYVFTFNCLIIYLMRSLFQRVEVLFLKFMKPWLWLWLFNKKIMAYFVIVARSVSSNRQSARSFIGFWEDGGSNPPRFPLFSLLCVLLFLRSESCIHVLIKLFFERSGFLFFISYPITWHKCVVI